MPRGAVMASLREGGQNGAPLFLRCFSTCFGSSGISEATEAMLLSFFLAPHKWRVSSVSFACRGDVQGVPKRHPFRLRGVVLAPLNACRQGVSTRESCVICVSELQKLKFLLFSSSPTISPKNGAINIVITISCCVFLFR